MASNVSSPIKKEPFEGQGKDQGSGGDRGKMGVKSEKDREKHQDLHTFCFCQGGQKESSISISCQWAGTILAALETSETFNSLRCKNQGKDVVIVRKAPHNADVATHFPCWLIDEHEELTIKFRSENTKGPEPTEKFSKDDLVMFYVDRIGGKNCRSRQFLINMKNTDISFLCVYARIEETVEKALRRDGRFADIVFEDGKTLGRIDNDKIVEMRGLVSKELHGQRFKLNMRQRAKAKTPDSTKKANSGSTPRSVRSAHAKPFSPYPGIPNTEELLNILRSQFDGLVRHMKAREEQQAKGEKKEVLELLREEFGKKTKVFWGVKNMRNLVELGESVCHIITKNGVHGTGFLLFDNFIVTNAHVVQLEDGNIVNADQILVNFHHEEMYTEKEHLLPVKVVFWAYGWVEEKIWLDYALLELNENEIKKMPLPLLPQYSPPIDSGGVCIIGHPDGGVKGLDLCSIIECKQRQSVIEKNVNIFQLLKWDHSIVAKDSQVMTYDTGFFHGSSGSPVFGERGQVVAMHTGGYSYKLNRTHSVIEYAVPLQSILQNFISQVVDKQRLDILKKFFEEARTCDALHPFIAEFITYLGTSERKPHFLDALWTFIIAVESDAESRERCWTNILQNMSEEIRQGLCGLLSQKLDERQKCECKLYQLLLASFAH